MRYNLTVAYLLWFFSGFGMLGFHRFYLGKVGTGILWMLSGGLAGAGCLYDALSLPRQVRDANLRADVETALAMGLNASRLQGDTRRAFGSDRFVESPEKLILRLARRNKGLVTVGEAAIEGDISVDEARKELDAFVKSGLAELRVRESGVLVYFFPEFGSDNSDFIDI